MKKTITRVISTLFVACSVLAIFSSCNAEKQIKKTAPTSVPDKTGNIYPLKTNVRLTYWCRLQQNQAALVSNVSDLPLYKELLNKTGVEIKFLHPTPTQEKEQFNILISSRDLPDIIEYNWMIYHGGPEKAIKDNQIIPLNDVIEKYAPNLKRILDGDKELNRMVKISENQYYVFPFIRSDESLLVYHGPFLRKDWLDELGLQVPTTIDEWYTVLKAFKQKKNVEAPLVFQYRQIGINNAFIGAYHITHDFYRDDQNKIQYGPIQPEYKEFLSTFKKWYSEGLIDRDFVLGDAKSQDESMLSGRSGATVANMGGGLGKYLDNMKLKDPKFALIAAPYPTLKKGEMPFIGQSDYKYTPQGSVAISRQCKNIDVAARFLDYGYSPEGQMLYNFGIEGVSYKMNNGYPQYTQEITKNPDGLTMIQAMAKYIRAYYEGPTVQDTRYLEQYNTYPEQRDAIEKWLKTDHKKHEIPSFLSSTQEETSELAQIINDVSTYKDEMFIKFIFGIEPLENYDKYVDQIKKFGIDKAITIKENAYKKYENR